MPDATHRCLPQDWHTAFFALPLDAPPADGWPRVASRLDTRRRRAPLWLATAAALVIAIAVPWQLQRDRSASPADLEPTPTATASPISGDDPLQLLYAESAQLESLLRLARDERVSSGAAAMLAGELDAQVASIDAALMQPDLSDMHQLALWQDRVDALRSVTGFESTRRWLVANGSRYDGALVHVD